MVPGLILSVDDRETVASSGVSGYPHVRALTRQTGLYKAIRRIGSSGDTLSKGMDNIEQVFWANKKVTLTL